MQVRRGGVKGFAAFDMFGEFGVVLAREPWGTLARETDKQWKADLSPVNRIRMEPCVVTLLIVNLRLAHILLYHGRSNAIISGKNGKSKPSGSCPMGLGTSISEQVKPSLGKITDGVDGKYYKVKPIYRHPI